MLAFMRRFCGFYFFPPSLPLFFSFILSFPFSNCTLLRWIFRQPPLPLSFTLSLSHSLSVSHPSNKTPVPLSYRTECGSTPIARAHNSLHPRRVFRNLRRTAAAVASLFPVHSWLDSPSLSLSFALGRTHGDDGRAFVSN